MADRYWVGGTGTWSSTNTANWSATSGGSTGASVPTATDNVFFDANSNTGTSSFTVTMANTPRVCNNITMSGLDGTMTLAGAAIGLTVSGSMTLQSTNLSLTYTGTTTFNSTATGKTINPAGLTFQGAVTFNGTGGGWQLQGALTTLATATTTLTAGALDLNNFTLTTGIFSSNNSNTRSIAFGTTGSIVVNTATAGSTVLDMATATGFSYTGTSNITAGMTVTRIFNFGGTAGATTSNALSVNINSGTIGPGFSGQFNNLDFTGNSGNLGTGVTLTCNGFKLGSGTYTGTTFNMVGTGTLDSNFQTIQALTINNSGFTATLAKNITIVSGNTVTLTAGTLDLNNTYITTGFFSSNNSNTRAIAFGTSGSITLNGTATSGITVLDMATATGFSYTGTPSFYVGLITYTRTVNFGGTSGATVTNAPNINFTSGSSVPTLVGKFGLVNFGGSTSNPGAVTISCNGFTLATGGTYTSTSFTILGTGTLTTNGKTISALTVNNSGFTATLGGALTNSTLTLTNGTLDLAGFTLTCTTTAQTAAGTKNLTFNGGTLAISAISATAWNNAQPTGFTTTAGTGTGTISMTAIGSQTFVGGGSTYNCTLNHGGQSILTITGANTFNNITKTNATATQITFPASTTTTVNNFTLSGSSGALVSIRSSSAGVKFTLSKSSGTVNVSYLNIQDSNATGGAAWYALLSNGNVNNGNNTGWNFTSPSGFLMFFC